MDIAVIDDDVSARALNADEPKPSVSLGNDLLEALKQVDANNVRTRLPMSSNRSVSIRIIPDGDRPSRSPSRDARIRGSSAPSRQHDMAPITRIPEKTMTPSERAYMWRMKFIRLNRRNKDIPIPETTDPESLEKMYLEAARTDHYCSTSATWLIYMGIGYVGFQYGLSKLGMELPPDFAFIQLQVMSHYPEIIKSLGDPGGPSLGSSWPPWLKLLFIIAAHTIIFILIYKITGKSSNAYQVQKFICSTGLMGGTNQGQELEADNAMANLGGIFGGLLGGGESGAGGLEGLGGMVQNIMKNIMGSGGDMDIDNPPPPVLDTPIPQAQASRKDSLDRPTMFD